MSEIGYHFIKLGITLQDCNLIGLFEDRQSGMNLAKVEGGQILCTIGAYRDNQFLSEVEFFAQFFPSHFLNPHFWSGPSLLLLRGSDTQFQGFDEVSLKSRDFRKWGPTFMILGTTNWSKSTFPTHFNDLLTLFPHPNSIYQNDPQLLRCLVFHSMFNSFVYLLAWDEA